MIDVFEIGASLNVHGNGMDFMKAFSGALMGAHNQLDALEKKIGATKGAMKDLFIGAGEVFAGAEILKGITHLAEAGKELNHQQSMLMRNGVTQRDVMRETSAIYKDMLTAVPTASAVDFLRTLGELKTVKGSIAGAREALTQSLKIEGLIGNSTGKSAEGQGYDFWRAVEDKGIIQNKAKTDAMLNRMVQGTIATGGKIGGNDWFTYARRAGSAWMGDDIDALPLQLMEMQTLGASGAGVARRAFANRTEGAIKLTKAQMAGWNEIGMMGPHGSIKDSALEQSRPDLFIGEVMEALKAHGIEGEGKVKAWAAHALHGKDADYFMTAYAGMSEVDPESGLTRLQKERRNMGEAQPLDQAYKTMMGTDFEANMHALQEQWKSFTEAVGGPAAKAMIPVLQGVTSFVTSMATFADNNQKLTQVGVDVAAVAAGLLVLGGSLRLIRGSLRLMGGGLFGMGRSALGGTATALNGSAAQLDASALALKEAAAALRVPGGGAANSALNAVENGAPAGLAGVTLGGLAAAVGLVVAPIAAAIVVGRYEKKREEETAKTWNTPQAQALPNLDDQTILQRLWGTLPSPFSAPSAYSREARVRRNGLTYDAPNTDGNALHRWDEMPLMGRAPSHPDDDRATRARASDSEAWRQQQDMMKAASQQFGELKSRTGLVLTGFENVTTTSTGLRGSLDVLAQTAVAAARALAQIAMGGGAGGGMGGGGSGIVNASWGGGNAFGGGIGAGGSSPLLRGARGAGGANPYVGGAGGGTFVPAIGDHLTAGMRNNNLGNIGWFGQHTAGLLGPSNARDVDHSIGKFATQDDGIRAAAALALTKYHKGRHSTWDIIAAKGGWTPGALGPGASVNVARAMGKSNRDDVHLDDPDQMVKFLHGLAVQEHGSAGRFYSEDRIRAALQHGSVPTAGPPPSGAQRRVTPGSPIGGSGTHAGAVTAENMPPIIIEHHSHTHLDGKKIAHEVTRHQVADARFKRSVGGTDNYGRRAHPGSEVMDA